MNINKLKMNLINRGKKMKDRVAPEKTKNDLMLAKSHIA